MRLGFYTDTHSRGLYYMAKPIVDLVVRSGHEALVFPRREKGWEEFAKSVDRLIVFEDPVDVFDTPADFVLLAEMFDPARVKRLERYERVIAPTMIGLAALLALAPDLNIVHRPWISDFAPACSQGSGFLFNAGAGGVHNRRGGPVACEAAILTYLAVGDGFRFTYKTQVVQSVQRLPGSFRLIGRELSREGMRALYLGHGIMLAPSRTEGCGLPFLEARALGLPVITVDAPPMNEHVKQGETGWLVPAFPAGKRGLMTEYDCQALDLSMLLSRLVQDAAEFEQMRARAHEHREVHHAPEVAAFEEFWADLWREEGTGYAQEDEEFQVEALSAR